MERPQSRDAASLLLPQTRISPRAPERLLLPSLETIRGSPDSWFKVFIVGKLSGAYSFEAPGCFAGQVVLEPPTQESHPVEGQAPSEPWRDCLGRPKLPFKIYVVPISLVPCYSVWCLDQHLLGAFHKCRISGPPGSESALKIPW